MSGHATIAIDILKWPGFNQAFLVSFLSVFVMTGLAMWYGKRRPVERKATWGEAMLGSAYVFLAMFIAFGIAPDRWIAHADNELGWSRDKLLFGPGGVLKPRSAGGWNPITLQYEALRDIVVVVIHAIYFGLVIFVWQWWQKRGDAKPSTEVATSTFGRPLVKKA